MTYKVGVNSYEKMVDKFWAFARMRSRPCKVLGYNVMEVVIFLLCGTLFVVNSLNVKIGQIVGKDLSFRL